MPRQKSVKKQSVAESSLDLKTDESQNLRVALYVFGLLAGINIVLSLLGITMYNKMMGLFTDTEKASMGAKAKAIRDTFYALLVIGVCSSVVALISLLKPSLFGEKKISFNVSVSLTAILYAIIITQASLGIELYKYLKGQLTEKEQLDISTGITDMYQGFVALLTITLGLLYFMFLAAGGGRGGYFIWY